MRCSPKTRPSATRSRTSATCSALLRNAALFLSRRLFFGRFACSLSRASLRASPLLRHLRSTLARLRKTDGDRLLAVLNIPARSATFELAGLVLVHRLLDFAL